MTNATLEKGTAKAAAPEKKEGPYRELNRGDIEISRIQVKAQHRKTFNEKALKELSDNIKKVGVLEPILLRYVDAGKNGYILIAGERRLRAAKMAGQAQIPSRVLDVNEDQAAEIQALENLHRADLGPVEEARAFRTLLDQKKYDVAGLAQRIDKSEAYVYRAVKLLELPKEVLDAIEKDEASTAHGHQLLRVPPESRLKVWKSFRGGTVDDLLEEINRSMGRSLDKSIFPLDKPYAGAVACTGCPYNSTNQGRLFSEEGLLDNELKGSCTNMGCFKTKETRALDEWKDSFQQKFPNAKFVGQVNGSYDMAQKAKVRNVTSIEKADLNKKAVAKALTEKKDGVFFGFEVSQWHGVSLHVVTTDAQLVNRALGRKVESSRSGSSTGYQAPKKDPRKEFIKSEQDKALILAAWNATEKPSKAQWQLAAKDTENGYLSECEDELKALNIKLADTKTASEQDLQRMVRFSPLLEWGGVNEHALKAVGVDVAKVKAEAQKKAGVAYDEKQKTAKKAPAKK